MVKTFNADEIECSALAWTRVGETAAMLGSFVDDYDAELIMFGIVNAAVNAASECTHTGELNDGSPILSAGFHHRVNDIVDECRTIRNWFAASYSAKRKKLIKLHFGMLNELVHIASRMLSNVEIDGYVAEIGEYIDDLQAKFGSDLVRVTVRRKAR